MSAPITTRALIDALVRSTGTPDPFAAMRVRAKDAIEKFRSTFGEPTMPLNVDALASLLGIGRSDDAPAHSEDAELVNIGNGRVSIRVNPDRPETRKRFSVGHEIGHTFFPNYQTKSWCRTDARYRRRDNPDDLVEILCDVGASELILPTPWFTDDAAAVTSAVGLIDLARKYTASREATLRRFAETHSACVAALFLSWKLKPTQQRLIGVGNQRNLFGTEPAEDARRVTKLRVDYAITSPQLARVGLFFPTDKSVRNSGPLYEAASSGRACDGECELDLGRVAGRYRVFAVPVWTADQDVGPAGENAVGAIIEPLDLKPPTPTRVQSLFE